MYIKEIINTYKDTVLFYEIIIVIASFAASMCKWGYKPKEKCRKKGTIIFSKGTIWLIISFLVLWFILAFADCGKDYLQYQYIFENSLNLTYWKTKRIESGYVLFNSLIRLFTNDFRIFHAIWAFALLSLVYRTIYRYRNYIHPGLAVYGFANLYFIQSMNLMRIYLAAALIFWGWQFLIENKFIKYSLIILIAMTIHTSAIICFLPLLFIGFTRKKGHFFYKFLIMMIFVFMMLAFRNSIFSGIMGYSYSARSQFNLGMAAFVYYLPLIFICFYLNKNKFAMEKNDAKTLNVLFIIIVSSFAFSLLSYAVDVLGRVLCYFMPANVIFPSFVIYLAKKNYFGKNKKMILNFLMIFIIVFIAFRGYMMFEYLPTDGTVPYTNIFGLLK